MSRDEALRDRLLDRRRKVHVIDAEITGAWIENPRLEAPRRQLYERVTLANRYCFRNRHDLSDELTRGLAGERQRSLDFSVLGKVLRVRKIKSTARLIESIGSLLAALESVRYLVNVS